MLKNRWHSDFKHKRVKFPNCTQCHRAVKMHKFNRTNASSTSFYNLFQNVCSQIYCRVFFLSFRKVCASAAPYHQKVLDKPFCVECRLFSLISNELCPGLTDDSIHHQMTHPNGCTNILGSLDVFVVHWSGASLLCHYKGFIFLNCCSNNDAFIELTFFRFCFFQRKNCTFWICKIYLNNACFEYYCK